MSYQIAFTKELDFAVKLAHQAGNIMLEYFDANQKVETKSDGTPVTNADKLINKLVIDEVMKFFPDDDVVGEEASTIIHSGRSRRWFCDPIDGTKPFTWGVPTSMFSLGLVVNDRPVLGVVYDPFLNRLYSGVAGRGSFCNEKRLQVSRVSLDKGFVSVMGSIERIRSSLPPKYLQALIDLGVQLTCFSGGVYKSMLVATGKSVAYIEEKVAPHDIAAMEVIVTEAGGKVTDLDGQPLDYAKAFSGAIISNSVVHDELVKISYT